MKKKKKEKREGKKRFFFRKLFTLEGKVVRIIIQRVTPAAFHEAVRLIIRQKRSGSLRPVSFGTYLCGSPCLTVRSREHFFTFRPPPRAPSDHVASRLHGKKGKRMWSRTLLLANRELPLRWNSLIFFESQKKSPTNVSPHDFSLSLSVHILSRARYFTSFNIQIEALEISKRIFYRIISNIGFKRIAILLNVFNG